MKNWSYVFLTFSFALIGYFFYNVISDAANGVSDFVADSTRFSHPFFVLSASAVSLFIGFVMNKKAAFVTTIGTASATATVDLVRLSKRLDNIEDRTEILEEKEVKTSELLTQLLSDENGLTFFNPHKNGFNPPLTRDFDLIPLDENTNRLELEPMVIVENTRKSRKK